MREISAIFHWLQASSGSIVLGVASRQGNYQVQCDFHVPLKNYIFHFTKEDSPQNNSIQEQAEKKFPHCKVQFRDAK